MRKIRGQKTVEYTYDTEQEKEDHVYKMKKNGWIYKSASQVGLTGNESVIYAYFVKHDK